MSFKFMYKGVEYDSTEPKVEEMLMNDPEFGKEFKRRVIKVLNSLTPKAKGTFMDALNIGLNNMIHQLVDIIKVEKGLQSKPTTDVEEWTKDGNLLTKFKNDNGEVTVNVCFCTAKAREYVNELLGYEVKTAPYTYSNGFKGLAVVLN